MKRRDILPAVAPLVLLPAGCLSAQNSDSDAESYESASLVETGWGEEGPLVGGLSPHSETGYHLAVVESPSDSDVNREYLRQNDGHHLLDLVDETSFEAERVLGVQARHASTARHFDTDSIDVDVDERIEGSIAVGAAEGGEDAESRETLFVRIEVGSENPSGARITVHEDEDTVTVTAG